MRHRTDAGGAQEYYLTDGLGSTTGIADGSGSVVATYQYDAFGAVRAQTGGSANEFTFTGEQVDGSGLQFLRARYYDPATGRFLSKDPVEFLQRYAYAENNPVNLTDPSGKEAAALTTTTMVLAPELVTPAVIAAVIVLGIYCVHEAVDDGNLWPCSPLIALLDALLEAREMELRRELAGPNVVQSEASEGEVEGGAEAEAEENAGQPPLKPLHDVDEEKVRQFERWSTEKLVESLAPDGEEPLITRPNGTIVNGHHRVEALRRRGYNVDSLPRIIQPYAPLSE